MNDHTRRIQFFATLTLIIPFALFFLTLFSGTAFHYYDFILFLGLAGIAAFAIWLGLVPGLILCGVVIFLYGSIIFYQMATASAEIWTLNYIWFAMYPLTAFLSGQIHTSLIELKELSIKCENIVEKVINIDEFTGYGNARELLRDLDAEMARAKRHKIPMTLLLLQIQYFKELMSIYGKTDSSKIYKTLSESINSATRIEDLRYRISEDMICVILPHTLAKDAEVVKRRIKESLDKFNIDDQSSLNRYNIEVKISLVEYTPEIPNPMAYKALAIKELEYDV